MRSRGAGDLAGVDRAHAVDPAGARAVAARGEELGVVDLHDGTWTPVAGPKAATLALLSDGARLTDLPPAAPTGGRPS